MRDGSVDRGEGAGGMDEASITEASQILDGECSEGLNVTCQCGVCCALSCTPKCDNSIKACADSCA